MSIVAYRMTAQAEACAAQALACAGDSLRIAFVSYGRCSAVQLG
jgi:hypothetical protein